MIHTAHYLLFELIWALPVLGLQWALGWRYLLHTWRLWVPALLALTIYFSLADAVAIQQGIWRFDETALVGLSVGNVPVEEVLFYGLTDAMILQGMVLGWFFLAERQAFTDALLPWRARRRQALLPAEEPQHQQSEGGRDVVAKMKSWPDLRARYAAGVWAAPFALLPGFVLSAVLGQPSPLEPLAQFIIQLTPIGAANVLLDFFGPFARPLALLGALAICLPFGGCCGMLAPGREPRWRWVRWTLSGALALAGAGVLALGADDAAAIWPALLAGVCFLPAFWLVRGFRQPVPSLAGRRRALKMVAGAALSAASIATIGAYQFWSSLGQTLLGRGDAPPALTHLS